MLTVTSRRLAQLLPALIVYIGFFSNGIIRTWTSPVFPKLEMNDSSISLTHDEESWIVAVPGIGGGIMAPFVGLMSDRLGRKNTMILTMIPLIINWIIILAATSPGLIIAARCIAGISAAGMYVVGPVYIGELAQEDIRGILGSMIEAFHHLGFLFSYCVGPYTSYWLFSGLCCIFPVLFMLLMLFMPETPYYLVKRNEINKASLALMRLRNDTAQGVKEEMSKIEMAVKEQTKNKGTLRDLFMNRASRRGLMIVVILFVIIEFSGTVAIISYSERIFMMAPGISLTSSQCAITVGAIEVMSIFITVTLVDNVGRRPLLMVSTLGCGIVHFVLGTYFYFQEHKYDIEGFEWIPLTFLVLLTICFCLGLSSIPVLMLGEMFPSNVKDLSVSISILISAFCTAIVAKCFQIMTDSIGSYSPFWLFSAVTTCGFGFVFFVVPETKGKRIETIIAELNGHNRMNNCYRLKKKVSDINIKV